MDRLLDSPTSRSRLSLKRFAVLLTGITLLQGPFAQAAGSLEVRPGDHISLIGNTLADRMQHDGWLETYLYSRFPDRDLVVRNLGFSGDEIDLSRRIRSKDFGTPDHWLTFTKADVIFAFFGYNESFAGQAGLDAYKEELTNFIKHSLAQKYNGKEAPRLVLFSPIAHENLHQPNLPDGAENNARLKLYTAAMREVARAHGVLFVDLFTPTSEIYKKSEKALTINGVHLNEEGNRELARVIDEALFPDGPAPKRDPAELERLRNAVVDKAFHWFNRYRTVDGYSIYGGRADLKFTDGQTNRVVAQREMKVLDVMTGNRDQRIWAVAKGGDLKVDDINTPPFIPVITNKPGKGPNGEHIFLDGEEEIRTMTVAKGLKVNLFASEKEFPLLAKPVQMSFDPKGRLWVAVWPTYPHWKPKEEMNDKLLIFEDTDGDGKADSVKTFADHLHCPTGFEFANGGVYVAQAPDLVFLKDTDGDDKADVRQRVLSGLDSADTHHTSNSFLLDPGGALYFQEGTFHHTQVETPYAPSERCINAGVFRYEPRTQKFDVYVSYSFANPHGHVFDRWGQDIVTDGTGAVPYHGTLFSGHLDFPEKHGRAPSVYKQRTRPCPGLETLSSRHFPESMQGNLLVPNVIGFQGILQYKIEDNDASLSGTELEPILSSSDLNFRPSDVEIGPDGAIYFLDWQNPIIGHMQHNLRDPSRDRLHGRVYRITAEGRPLLKSPKIAGEPVETLLDLLKEPEDRVRYRVKTELGARPTEEVLAPISKWVASLDKTDPDYEHHVLEALWVHQYHNTVNIDLLKRVLRSPDFRARAAATRVLCYWRDRVPEALELLKTQAADTYPRVRLEAIRAASFFKVPEAIEIPLIAAEHPLDEFLEYTSGETRKALDPYWKNAIAKGQPIAFTTAAGARFILKNIGTDELLKMKRDRGVELELLFRKGIRDEVRREALTGLAKRENKPELRVLIDAIRSQDGQKGDRDESVVFDLARLLTGRSVTELAGVRGDLEAMAIQSVLPVTRQLGFVALIAADVNVEKAWALGEKSVPALRDLLGAMPLIRDPGLRASLYPKVEPLLNGLPKSLASSASQAKGTYGRYVRIELPGRQRTLTLAEVEVMSDGRNLAPAGKASQKNTSNRGEAKRAIDGNRVGDFSSNGQTHSEENTPNPWWEVDLGAEQPLDSIIIYNRTDGNLGKRLDNFNLTILDGLRNVVLEKSKQPATTARLTYKLSGGGPEDIIRRAAMNALTYVRGQEAQTFKSLARFVSEGIDRPAAIQALQRIPAADWPEAEARPLLDRLIAHVRTIPAADRTNPAALDALQLADALASKLPLEQAKRIRKELGELGVRIIRLGTLPEQMLFDKERLAVNAGKPVEIRFENNDLMPHNVVVIEPGTLEEVGLLGESTATDPGALARNYVPSSKGVILASRLLQPRESQTLAFTAPSQPGVYPYVCTYPGHWRRMYGSLYVVADLDEYLADPESYLAKNPLPIKDDLLKSNRPRKEWKFEDLVSAVAPLASGRSFSNGKQIFQVATCIACHKVDGAGQEFGPDLTKLDSKLTPADILREILEPSAKINEKFQAYTLATESGKVLTGLILEETPNQLKLIENPLAKTAPVVLKPSEIAERAKSPISIMPKGLLDKLTREEILDLVAYIASRANPKSELYQSGGHDHSAGGH
ncbi:PVC-type heme-binding CxxCH protein [Singulisphaera sp. Ch08]|uniref:PVC-type heme-binding CxxCH protein n=1 Tax=Singulisphaera sp. Ch08 TaxID=3120278 RepID=A0AAU7C8K1_9BACT